MEPYDTQFQNDPVAFCGRCALRPNYGRGEQDAFLAVGTLESGSNYKVDATGADFAVLRAYGRCRVAFATIVQERIQGEGVKNGYLMMLFRQAQKGRFPTYWLPYDPSGGRSSMVKLKPSKKVDEETSGRDPDLFITDALNGCTVTISGTPEEPIVYHSPQQEEAIRTSVEGFHVDYAKRKSMANNNLLHWGNEDYGAYFPEVSYQGSNGGELLNIEEARFSKEKRANKNTLKMNEGATIFGFCRQGSWEFHCQEWIHLIYEWGLWSYSEKLARRCYRLWPDGESPPAQATVFVGNTLKQRGLL